MLDTLVMCLRRCTALVGSGNTPMMWGSKDKVGPRHPVVLCGPEEMLWLCREGKIIELTSPDVSQAVRNVGIGKHF